MKAFGERPYPGLTNFAVMAKIDEGYRMEAPEGCPGPIHSVMLHCWEQEWRKRPQFSDLVNVLQKLYDEAGKGSALAEPEFPPDPYLLPTHPTPTGEAYELPNAVDKHSPPQQHGMPQLPANQDNYDLPLATDTDKNMGNSSNGDGKERAASISQPGPSPSDPFQFVRGRSVHTSVAVPGPSEQTYVYEDAATAQQKQQEQQGNGVGLYSMAQAEDPAGKGEYQYMPTTSTEQAVSPQYQVAQPLAEEVSAEYADPQDSVSSPQQAPQLVGSQHTTAPVDNYADPQDSIPPLPSDGVPPRPTPRKGHEAPQVKSRSATVQDDAPIAADNYADPQDSLDPPPATKKPVVKPRPKPRSSKRNNA